MKITDITAFIVKIPEEECFGGAGIGGTTQAYAAQPGWRGLYARHTECLIVKIQTDEGITGFGEGQAPIAPEVSATVVEKVLRPILMGRDPADTAVLRYEMY